MMRQLMFLMISGQGIGNSDRGIIEEHGCNCDSGSDALPTHATLLFNEQQCCP